MRSTLTILLLSCALYASCQVEDSTEYLFYKNVYGQRWNMGWFNKLLRVPNIHNGTTPTEKNAIGGDETGRHLWIFDGQAWNMASGGEDTMDAGPFTSVPAVNFNPGTHLTPKEIILAAFYRAQPPTATLSSSNGGTQELMELGPALSFTLTWSAGRNNATKPIGAVTVAGIPQTFSQPAAGNSVSGTQVVQVPRNTTTTIQAIVTTEDNQTTTASVTIPWSARRYYGWLSSDTPTDAEILSLSSEFSSSTTKTYTQPGSTGEKHYVYVYPASWGLLTKLDFGGISAINAVLLTTRPLTNASGYTQAYNIYITSKLLDASKPLSVAAQ
jgi:hypothetical protein